MPTLKERNAARMGALSRLTGAIAQALDGGEHVPCVSSPSAHWWTSEHADELEAAAAGCIRCPVIGACAAYVDQHAEVAGTWAGRIRRTRQVTT